MGALVDTAIGGLTNNLGFLQDLARSQAFATATIDTGLLDRDLTSILNEDPPQAAVWHAAAIAFLKNQEAGQLDSHDPWSLMDGWRLGSPSPRHLKLMWRDQTLDIHAMGSQVTGYELLPSLDESERAADPTIKVHYLDTHQVDVIDAGTRWRIQVDNHLFSNAIHGSDDGSLVTPMPGLIMDVQCSEGDQVVKGQSLIVMEAMKMEIALRAPFDGVISEICISAGKRVDGGAQALKIVRAQEK